MKTFSFEKLIAWYKSRDLAEGSGRRQQKIRLDFQKLDLIQL